MRLWLPLLLLFPCFSWAQVKHELVRRIAVFPIADIVGANGEEAWWQMREVLTKDQRFFVASRRFMINRGVFQPRKNIKPADAIILSKILDAQALVISYVQERRIFLKVFEGENGILLWESQIDFHPAIPINDQIVKVTQTLMANFVSEVPYQSFTIIDAAQGKAVFEDSGRNSAWIFAGSGSGLEVGDPVQWIEIKGEPGKPLLQSGAPLNVVGEGRVSLVKEDQALVEVLKVRDPADIYENSLVRLPKEVKNLRGIYASENAEAKLSAEYLTQEMKTIEDHQKRQSKSATALAFILNFAALVLLAF